MADLRLSHIYKVYDNGHKAVNDFSIDIKDKEFIVFVGPSGCGKSTTLRMIAGLEKITAGDLFIGETLVNDVEPKDRDIAMVFQNYALYPHMTVYENMAFGLRNRHIKEDIIKEKVLEAARILDITEYLDRKPKAMSGGQRQRVALGRAIVRDPKVFLLDEPLSNLDAKLRAQMRTEITKLHKKLQTTFIYVTHDQVEAMTMGSRIVVMKLGYVQQIDTPMNLYNHPNNKFVAGFIGTPQMNFFDVTLNRKGDNVAVKFGDGSVLNLGYEYLCKINDDYLHGNKPVCLGARPEHLKINNKKQGLKVIVNVVEHLGNETIIYGSLGESYKAEKDIPVIIKVSQDLEIASNAEIYVDVDFEKLHFFDGVNEHAILKEVPDYSIFDLKVKAKKLHILDHDVELPPYYASVLDAKTKYTVEIAPTAIVPGKDFTLPVVKVEEIDGVRLAHLQVKDQILFASVDSKVKEGSSYSFSLLYDQLRVFHEKTNVLEETEIEVPETFASSLNASNTHEVLIPIKAVVKGKKYTYPVTKIHEVGEQKLAEILVDDKVLFALVDKDVVEGYNYSFDIVSNMLIPVKQISVDVEPIGEKVNFLGDFAKEERIAIEEIAPVEVPAKEGKPAKVKKVKKAKKIKKRVIDFFYIINGQKIAAPVNNGYKINSVEGVRCYKKKYRYSVSMSDIHMAEEGIPAQVIELLDYKSATYAKLQVADQEILLKVDPSFAENEVKLAIDGEKINVYNSEIDMLIC